MSLSNWKMNICIEDFEGLCTDDFMNIAQMRVY